MSVSIRMLAAAAMMATAGCGDGLVLPKQVSTSPLGSDERLARSTAAALRLPQHARFLRDELRASPYTRHRVSLQDLLGAPSAAEFTSEIARQLEMTPQALLAELRERPALNIWMPSRAQRTTWQGTPMAVVTATFGENSKGKRAFTSAGEAVMSESIRDNPSALGSGSPPVFMIAPSRGLDLRPTQTVRVGSVVQQPDEMDFGGRRVRILPNGDSTVTQLAPMMNAAYARARESRQGLLRSPLSPFDDGTPAPNVVADGRTYLKGLIIVQGEDFNSPTNDLELRWQAKKRSTSDNHVMYSENHNMDMDNEYASPHEFEVISRIRDNSGYIWLKLLEDDGGWGVDHYGEYSITNESPNYYSKAWSEPYFGGGAGRCGYTTVNGHFACPHTTSYGVYYWAEVNFNLQWIPYSAPPVVASVVGPAYISPSDYVTWSVADATGSSPLTYDWYLDGNHVGSGSTYSATIAQPASVHSLVVDVYNGSGYFESASMMVSVNTGSCDPNDPNCNEYLREGAPAKGGRLPVKASRRR